MDVGARNDALVYRLGNASVNSLGVHIHAIDDQLRFGRCEASFGQSRGTFDNAIGGFLFVVAIERRLEGRLPIKKKSHVSL